MRIAIVHDWLVGGGAERVVLELHRMYPDAPIYTSYCSDEWRVRLDNKVVTGWLQAWPFSRLRKYIPFLRIWWFTHLDLSNYDLVISSSGNGEAKGIKVARPAKHLSYCHSPTHFYWRHYDKYLARPGFGVFDPVARLGLKLLVGPLRSWDRHAAQRPDVMLANSRHIQADIKTYYGRESEVVHPPIDIERFIKAKAAEREGFVTMGRLVPHKHVDIIVQACSELNLPLKVIGRGPDLPRLKTLAGPTVHFLTDVSDAEMPVQLASASGFIFASFDDFGIAPVEALSAGTPLIAYQAGGALDYVVPGKSGEFFKEQTVESLKSALLIFKSENYKATEVRKVAKQFRPQHFQTSIRKAVTELLK